MKLDMQELKKCKKVLVEVNQTCNLNCTYCFYRDYGRVANRINLQNIDNLLENCPSADEFYLTGGECFTSPVIEEIVERLAPRGKVITFTNGVILNKYDDERLNKVLEPSEFSVRAWSILRYYNINTLGELVSLRKRDIMAMRNLGKVTMNELEDYISKFGYQFK